MGNAVYAIATLHVLGVLLTKPNLVRKAVPLVQNLQELCGIFIVEDSPVLQSAVCAK